ncbi:MAG: glycosyltransferase family 4 protein [Thermoanaerobaculia bacterium]
MADGAKARPLKLVVVHSIPSPYRLHLFAALSQACKRSGIQFRVEFMAKEHQDRKHWAFRKQDAGFTYRFWQDVGPMAGGRRWHWNPELLRELCRECPEFLMVGGIWDSVTGAALTASKPCGALLSWIEGNARQMGRTSGVVGRVKRLLMTMPDAFVVPGGVGEDFIRAYEVGRSRRPVLRLPNLVDERRFQPQGQAGREQARKELGILGGRRVALWPARLIPEKGILEFLASIELEDFAGGSVLLVGDGPLRGRIQAEIERRALASVFELRPSVPYEQMPNLYWAADLFLLPSIRDQNPLSVVEALHAGLPLLLSGMAGNADEALTDERNGWRLDPSNRSGVRKVIREAFTADRSELDRMGAISRTVGAKRWGSEEAAKAFVEAILRRVGQGLA